MFLPLVGKKKDKKHAAVGLDAEAELKRLRKENAHLRKQLKKIAEIASDAVEGQDTEPAEAEQTEGDTDQITAAEEASPVPAV